MVVQSIASGSQHTCVVLDDRSVKCWGYNGYGRLGYGDTIDRGDQEWEMGDGLPAVSLGAGRTAVSIAAANGHTCAVLDDRSVKCWGWNGFGQLGYGDRIDRGDGAGEMGDGLAAVSLGTGRTAVSIAAGVYHTCAVLDDRSVKCWGRLIAGTSYLFGNDILPLNRTFLLGGKISLVSGSSAAGAGMDCACIPGFTAEANGMACTACAAGTYKPFTGPGRCSACVAGYESLEGAAICTSSSSPLIVIAAAAGGAAVLMLLAALLLWWRCRRSHAPAGQVEQRRGPNEGGSSMPPLPATAIEMGIPSAPPLPPSEVRDRLQTRLTKLPLLPSPSRSFLFCPPTATCQGRDGPA